MAFRYTTPDRFGDEIHRRREEAYTYDTYVQPTEEEIRMRNEQREWERDREKKEDLYNSVIDSYIIIEHVKQHYQQHYQDNKKSQGELIRIQAIITILQILGVAVIYFNYSYSVLIFLGVFCLDMYEQRLIYEKRVPYLYRKGPKGWWSLREYICLASLKKSDYKSYNYFRTKAINHYGKGYVFLGGRAAGQPCDYIPGETDFMTMTDDMVEKFKKDLDILDKLNETAKKFCDCSFEKCNVYYNFCALFFTIFLTFGWVGIIALGYEIEKKNYFQNERKNHTDTEIIFKYTMFITGSLFIVLKLIVRHIIIKCCYNPKIDMSPLFVKQPSERQPLLTNTIV